MAEKIWAMSCNAGFGHGALCVTVALPERTPANIVKGALLAAAEQAIDHTLDVLAEERRLDQSVVAARCVGVGLFGDGAA